MCATYPADVPLNSIKFVRGHNNPASQDDKDGPRGPGGGRASGERGGGKLGARGGQGMDGKDASGKLNRPGEQNCQVRHACALRQQPRTSRWTSGMRMVALTRASVQFCLICSCLRHIDGAGAVRPAGFAGACDELQRHGPVATLTAL